MNMKMKFRATALGSGHTVESRSLLRLADTDAYLGLASDFDSYHRSLENGNTGIVKIETDEQALLFIQIDPDTLTVVPDPVDYEAEVDGMGVEYAE